MHRKYRIHLKPISGLFKQSLRWTIYGIRVAQQFKGVWAILLVLRLGYASLQPATLGFCFNGLAPPMMWLSASATHFRPPSPIWRIDKLLSSRRSDLQREKKLLLLNKIGPREKHCWNHGPRYHSNPKRSAQWTHLSDDLEMIRLVETGNMPIPVPGGLASEVRSRNKDVRLKIGRTERVCLATFGWVSLNLHLLPKC